eukprot:4122439-Pleurochrysis_carterae.AAC.1
MNDEFAAGFAKLAEEFDPIHANESATGRAMVRSVRAASLPVHISELSSIIQAQHFNEHAAGWMLGDALFVGQVTTALAKSISFACCMWC